MTFVPRPALALGALVLVLGPRAVVAQEASDPAAAEVLFREGRKLHDAGDKVRACAKFAGSYLLDRAPGTLLNLAECSRNEGKTATAWSQFVEAAEVFRRREDDRRAAFASDEAKKLEPKLARFVVRAADTTPGLQVRRDGTLLGAASIETPLPVDPGMHELTAEAPGRSPGTVRFQAKPGQTVEVLLPTLTLAEPSAQSSAVSPLGGAEDEGTEDPGEPQRIAGWIASGTGVLSIAVGGIFIGLTAERRGALDELCPGDVCGPGAPQDTLSQANTYANVANGLLVAGVVTAGVGLVVLVTAPSGADAAARTAGPTVACSVAGCSMTQRF